MSGHSHFSTIKRKKEITDAKRSKIFSKMARVIYISAKEKGGDPESNSNLRMVIEKAKELNMPKDKIERAIKKGIGELEGEALESLTFEAFGPGGIAIIIEGITDNKNRSLGEIKKTLSNHNGKMAGEGSVKWLFERKGVITVNFPESNIGDKEELEMIAIEAEAEDILWEDSILTIYTKPEALDKIKKTLEAKSVKIESSSLGWKEKETISLDEKTKESCERLFEALDENDSVQDIYSNLKT